MGIPKSKKDRLAYLKYWLPFMVCDRNNGWMSEAKYDAMYSEYMKLDKEINE